MSNRRRKEEPKVADPTEAQPIHVKYRPTELDDVLGQGPVVASLKSQIKKENPPHAFLFVGPAGTGKTTLARILAKEFKTSLHNIVEIDAASKTGVDDMREVTAAMRYHGFGETSTKFYIIDECHRLTKQAWESLLKSLEEPPPHVFFALCTTDPGKILPTIMSRCSSYNLAAVKFDQVMDLLEDICDKERFNTDSKVLEMIARACDGSPRRALTMLATVHDLDDMEDVAVLLAAPMDNKEVIDLCRQLVQGKLTWPALTKTLKAMPEMTAESIRIVISSYLTSCLLGATTDRQAQSLLDMLYAFSRPYNATDKHAPLLLSFGDVMFR